MLVICLSVFCAFLMLSGTASAVASDSKRVITPGEMKEWDNGAKVTCSGSGSGSNFRESMVADTSGLKKGYYSVFLYDVKARNLQSYDGFAFNLKNQNDSDLKINLTFTVNSKTSLTLSDSSYAILESSDQSISEAITPAYGTLSIPANFDGTVYIPLSKLCTSDGKTVSPAQIQSWGITSVMTENQQVKYQAGNFELLSGSIASMKASYYLFSLTGSSRIAVSNTGSVIEFYQAQVKDLDGNPVGQAATYSLKKAVSGVTISKDGRLEVDSDCTAPSVTVCSKLANSVDDGELTVSLQHGRTVAAAGIPRPSAVPKITTPAESKLNGFMNWIRFAAIVIAVFFGVIFYSWFSEAKSNYLKIKDKLSSSDNYEGKEKI